MYNYEDFLGRCNGEKHASYIDFVNHKDEKFNLPPLPTKDFFENNNIELIDYVVNGVLKVVSVQVVDKYKIEEFIQEHFDAIYSLTPIRGASFDNPTDTFVSIKVRGLLNEKHKLNKK